MPTNPASQAVQAAQDEASRMRREWDSFGEPCAGSRWFNTIPQIEMDDSRRLVWRCPVSHCGGEMRYTGVDWPTGVPGHHHKCSNCSFTAAIKGAIFGEDASD